MKILFTSDLHGHTKLYEQLLYVSKMERVESVIIGGDLLPNNCKFEESPKVQRKFIQIFMVPFFSQLREINPFMKVYLMMGNDDWAINMDLLESLEKKGTIRLLHKKIHPLKDFFLVGYGCVPITPFSVKDWERFDGQEHRAPEESFLPYISAESGIRRIKVEEWLNRKKTIEEELRELSKRTDPEKTVWVMHAPPFETNLDRLYNGDSVGSRAIRKFIMEHHPYLTLHGHIHESPRMTGKYMDRIGTTISINPGQEKDRLHAVIFELFDVQATIKHTLKEFNTV